MRKKIKILFIAMLLSSMYTGFAQQVTHLGNSQRQARNAQYGPEDATQLWEVDLDSSISSQPTWYYENMAIFSMTFSYSPRVQELMSLDIHTGEVIWETSHGLNLGILGIQDGLIYAMGYTGGAGSQQIYAIDTADGSISSILPTLTETNPIQGIAFTAETGGDFILPGPGSFISRINKDNGEIVWQLPVNWAVSGNGFVALSKDYKTGYTWDGLLNAPPQKLVAFDVETGEELYRQPLPNNSGQQNNIMTGPDNSIFIQPNDFPGLIRYKDTGQGIETVWTAPDVRISFGMNLVLNKDNTIIAQKNNKVVKIDFETGEILGESSEAYLVTRYTGVDLDGKIYLIHGEPSTVTCLDDELNVLYQIPLGSGAYYSNAIPGPDGIMVLTSPRSAMAYQTDQSSILFPPNNFAANVDVNTNAVTLSWTEPNSNNHNLLGYNVYKNGDKINETIITGYTYNYDEVASGGYHYYATAVYDQGESDASFWDYLLIKARVSNVEGTVSVLASGDALEGAVVSIGDHSYTTGADGVFGIYEIEPGEHEISVVASGFNTYLETVNLEEGETTQLEIEMTAPYLEYSLDEIQLQLLAGEHEDVTLSITNTGDGPANWTARVFYEDLFRGADLVRSSGTTGDSDVFGANHSVLNEPVNYLNTEMQFSYDVSSVTGSTSIIGAETDGTYFYLTNFNNEEIYKLSLEGELVETFTIPGVTKLRDLAYDGTYFYGGSGGSIIYQMDFNNRTLMETININATVRSLAYDADADGFWVNDWNTDLTLYSRQGAVLNSFALPAGFNANYGTAYDNISEGGPYLWLFVTNEGDECHLEQYEIASGNPTGVNYEVSDILGATDPGGLFLVPNLIPNTITVGGIAQSNPDILFGVNAGLMDNWIIPETFDGVIEAGETLDMTITVKAPEEYAGETLRGSVVFNPQPYVGSHTIQVILDALIGVNDLKTDTISVFPNPASDVVYVQSSLVINSITVYDVQGRKIQATEENSQDSAVNTSGLNSGVYFFSIETEKGVTVKKVLVL